MNKIINGICSILIGALEGIGCLASIAIYVLLIIFIVVVFIGVPVGTIALIIAGMIKLITFLL